MVDHPCPFDLGASVRLRDLSPYTRQAVELTHRRCDGTNTTAPTWDGTALHIARIHEEQNVIHEVAHWIIASPEDRLRVNYGLGTDPDEGPFTPPKWVTTPELLLDLVSSRGVSNLRQLAGNMTAEDLMHLSDARTNHEESLAALVTIILLRIAGLPWAAKMKRTMAKLDRYATEAFWFDLHELSARGINLDDPLQPFRAAEPSR